MRDVFLIRHAESRANIGEATSTPREIPLSEKGLAQADDLVNVITDRPDLIVLSPYVRSRQTAEPFLELYPDVEQVTLLIQEFTYLSVSKCRGTSYEQRKPLVAQYWQNADPGYSDGDQAESFAEFIGRCADFERQMREKEYELAFVFTHEQFIKGLLWNSMRLGREMTTAAMQGFQKFMTSFTIPNTAFIRAKVDGDGTFYFGKMDTANTETNA